MLMASDICWDVDTEDALEYLYDMSAEYIADALGVSVEDYITMDEEDRYDIAENYWGDNPKELYKLMGLPDEVVIPADIEKIEDEEEREDTITDWLSDEYGFCINGYTLLTDKENLQDISGIEME